jgi:hypothetical protein
MMIAVIENIAKRGIKLSSIVDTLEASRISFELLFK